MPKEYLDCVAALKADGKTEDDAQRICAIAFHKRHGMTPQEAEDNSMKMAERVKRGWIPVFRTGTHTDMSGRAWTFSGPDLDSIVECYSPGKHEAPAVIGHPANDQPAYAWARQLARDGEVLWVELRAVAAEFADWVRQGFYKKISIALYHPEEPGNPVPGRWYLRHIGFLGAAPPAVKGLPPVQLADKKAICFEDAMPLQAELAVNEELGRLEELLRLFWDHVWYIRYGAETPDKKAAIQAKVQELGTAIDGLNFSESRTPRDEEENPMEKKTFMEWLRDGLREVNLLPAAPAPVTTQVAQFTEAQVLEREAAAAARAREDEQRKAQSAKRQAEVRGKIRVFVEAGIKAGTFLPAWKEQGIPAVLEQLLLQDPMEFAEGKKQNPGEILLAFFGELPKVVTLQEIAGRKKDDPALGAGSAGEKLDALVRQHMMDHKTNYNVAFVEVQKAHPDLAKEYAAEVLPPSQIRPTR
ncbi:MAG: hypothetical protein A3E79_04450 [Burkholderiales bacterium RIFCSPHIGHO2_12_FULL_61_11]|nr:MAG: hypothetical protein A3E79_04450 [Burkholderiales bacterium RIFCSPHIGHO2_12_FULL_61_11]